MTTDSTEDDTTKNHQGEAMNKKVKTEKLMFPELAALKTEMDFERGARSAPNSRSCSFKNKPRHKGLRLRIEEPRRNSMPVTSDNLLSVSYTDISTSNEPLQRIRSFKTTSKGIENHGDSFRRKSNSSIASSGSAKTTEHSWNCSNKRHRIPSDTSDDSTATCSCSSSSSPGYYRVLVLGEVGVGKTELMGQLMTSEYMADLDMSTNMDNGDLTVSVLLDGEESTLEFIEESEVENDLDSVNVDAYLVVFSVDDRGSFDLAVGSLKRLRYEVGTDRTVIVVANKIDLVRKRQVTSEEAKKVAEKYYCKYTETSVTLNHNVDELLVGIVRQIRLKLNPEINVKFMPTIIDFQEKENRKLKSKGPKSIISKFFRKASKQDSSCEDLFDL